MAYGTIPPPPPTSDLPILSYTLPDDRKLVLFPITLSNLPEGLGEWLGEVFNEELAAGKTYPQQGPLTPTEFISYYFSATTIVGIITNNKVHDRSSNTSSSDRSTEENPETVDKEHDVGVSPTVVTGSEMDILHVKGGREWSECVGGCYYVKPNYPGRASHNCNAGFLVPPTSRGLKIGMTLGRSYLIYAKALGYRGSVFNLVFKNNVASLAIWDRLGFSRVGLIPKAGRLKSGPGGEEEYVDAVVIWKDLTVSGKDLVGE